MASCCEYHANPANDDDAVVCRCLRVTASAITETVDRFGLTSVKEIVRHTGAGGGCTACRFRLECFTRQTAYSEPPICSAK